MQERHSAEEPKRYWYSSIPVMGGIVEEAFYPERPPYRRFGDKEDRSRRLKARVLSLLTIASGLVYLVWLPRVLNPEHPLMSGAFLAAEVLCFGLFFVAVIDTWRMRFKPQAGIELEADYSVDVFVPVCGESIEIIRRTLEGVREIQWRGPIQRYVLDDGDSPEVRELASQFGFSYLTRGERTGNPEVDNKAANLNFGLDQSEGELVLVMDADQVPEPQIVEVLAGYMKFPRVAFVQSKQTFLVPEEDPFNSNGIWRWSSNTASRLVASCSSTGFAPSPSSTRGSSSIRSGGSAGKSIASRSPFRVTVRMPP